MHSDTDARRLSFAHPNPEQPNRYFIIDRSEESPDEAVPNLTNVYIELDDQCRGGFGWVERVVLRPNSLAVYLGPEGLVGDDEVRISFAIAQTEFEELRRVLRLIMRGYEDRLECVTI